MSTKVYAAIGTDTAGVAEPRDADALAHCQPFYAGSDRIDPADDLVTGDDRHLRVWKFAIDDMQIRPADAARGHLDANLPRPGLPIRQSRPFEGSPELVQHHCLHGVFLRVHGWLAASAPSEPSSTLSLRVVEALKHSRQQIRQILGQEAGSKRGGRSAVQPHRRGRGDERLHALGEEAEHDAAQDIA